LELGADDYVSKPFDVAELKARTRSALRRYRHPLSSDLRVQIDDRLTVDRAKCCVTINGRVVHLSALEYKLLDCFVENAGRVLTHQTLLSHIWGWEYAEETDYLKVYVHRLRAKIEQDPAEPRYIVTERGLGYRFYMS
jgi:two-component system KDP operon response regulator KdpE